MDVRLPDGTVVKNVPEGTTKEQLMQKIGQEPEQGFVGRVGEDLSQRLENIQAITGDQFPEQTVAEDILQVGGQVAGGLGDIAGEALATGIRAITPDVIEEEAKDIAGDVGSGILGTRIGQLGIQAIQEGVEAYQNFKQQYPRAARNLESVVNVGLLAAPIKAKPAIGGRTAVGEVGDRVGEAAQRQVAEQRKQFAASLVEPKLTPTVRTERARRTVETGGIIKKREVVPSFKEQTAIDAVVDLPNVSPNNTLLGNLNAIDDAARKEGEFLKSALKQNEIIFPRKEVTTKIRDIRAQLVDNPLIDDAGERAADKLIKSFNKIAGTQPSTGSGLLETRKLFDKAHKKLFKVTDTDPRRIAFDEIRRMPNEFLIDRAKNVDVAASLRKQSGLLTAVDSLAPKVADEAATSIGRAAQRINNLVPFKGGLNKLTGALGAGGLLTATAINPAAVAGVAATGIAAKGALKGAASPQAKKALSQLIKGADEAIKVAQRTGDLPLIRQLQADRLLLISFINGEEVEDLTQEGKK